MKRILVIDDDKVLVELITVRLKSAGFEIIPAYDGETGLEKVKNEKPDLIVLDLMLPGIDGYEVCEQIKTDAKYKHIPIIMFTARTGEEDKRRGYAAGTDDYITKPFDAYMMVEKIREFLKE